MHLYLRANFSKKISAFAYLAFPEIGIDLFCVLRGLVDISISVYVSDSRLLLEGHVGNIGAFLQIHSNGGRGRFEETRRRKRFSNRIFYRHGACLSLNSGQSGLLAGSGGWRELVLENFESGRFRGWKGSGSFGAEDIKCCLPGGRASSAGGPLGAGGELFLFGRGLLGVHTDWEGRFLSLLNLLQGERKCKLRIILNIGIAQYKIQN